MLATSFALAVTLAAGPAAQGAPPRADGTITTDEGQVELLAQPVPVGMTIELPEGFIRVEEEGTEDREVGSFAVVPAASVTATAAALAARPPAPAAPASGPSDVVPERARFLRVTADACRAERSAYLRDLWKMSGIDVPDPDALLLGLDSGDGPRAGFYWFALATDPFRPLAWSSDLRARGDALARCVREQLR